MVCFHSTSHFSSCDDSVLAAPPILSDVALNSSSTDPSSSEQVMTGGGINFVLEFLSIIWEQLKHSEGLNIFRLSSNPISCKMFLEAGTHAAGILKSSSSKELNRKRLTHMGALNVMSDGIKAVIHVSAQ
jgi:hypothetical protein